MTAPDTKAIRAMADALEAETGRILLPGDRSVEAEAMRTLCDALDTAQTEIERLQTIIDNLHAVEEKHRETANAEFHRANRLQVDNERLTKERDEARAQVAAAYKAAEQALESRKYGDPDEREEYAFDAALDRGIVAIRALTPADAQAALEAYGREKVREGMQRASEVAADRCAACGVMEIAGLVKAHILADMEKLK